MLANYNCLLLDVDGTLLDFSAAERGAIAGTLSEFDLPVTEETIALYSRINADLWAALERGEIKKDKLTVLRFETLLKELNTERDAIRMNNEFLTRLSKEAVPIPGAQELLEELAEFATLAVVSNGIHKVQMQRLKKANLLQYFDDIFVSEKMGVTKPSPRFFNQALKKLGVNNKEKVLVVGDSLGADIQGGKNAKLDTCWCNFVGAENTGKIQPTYEVQSYEQIKQIAIGEEALKNAALREKRHTV